MSRPELPYGQAFAYRDSKGIHGNSHRNDYEFCEMHPLKIHVETSDLKSPFAILNDDNILTINIFDKNLILQLGM